MKLKTLNRVVAAAVVALAALTPATMSAYDYYKGGIYYDVNQSQRTAMVTYKTQSGGSYQGDVVIPERVTLDGVDYTVTAIGAHAFSNSTVQHVQIPNTVKTIGDHAFVKCQVLMNVVIPNSVTSLGRCVFHTCSSLKSAVIGNSVPELDEYCFQYCSQLSKVVIGSSVSYLDIKVFYDCPSLQDVTCLAPEPPAMYAYYSFYTYSGTLTVNGSSLQAYKNDANWGRFAHFKTLNIAESVTLDKSQLTLQRGESQRLTATVLPADASQALSWTTSDENVATVSNDGVVSAVGAGQATIAARTTDGSGLSATCAVRVLADGVQNNNVLTLPDRVLVEKGDELALPVGMVNNAPISALQFDIELPQGFELAANGDICLIDLLDERVTANHSLYVRELSPGIIRVLISSINSTAFLGQEGDLLVLHLNIGNDVQDGEHAVTLTNVVLADANAQTYYAPDVSAIIEVKSFAKGDVNGDGTVNVGDYVTVANYILMLNPEPFVFSAADVDENGSIDVGDLVGVANIILGDEVAATPAQPANDGVTLSGKCSNAPDKVIVTIDLSNEMALTAWQMDVTLPDGLSLEQARQESRAAGHQLVVNDLGNGIVRLLGSSAANDELVGNEGALLTLELSGTATSDDNVAFDHILFAERDMTRHTAKAFGVSASSSAVKEFYSNVRIYGLNGKVMVETPVETTVELVMSNGTSRTVIAKPGVNTYPVGCGICIVRAAGEVAKLKL
ncbi:MAG: leucine-rich repeat protein [Muribaculaceae bacterium]|nr:leucine-rich repeat protein [Muribaculaceae bacterium]